MKTKLFLYIFVITLLTINVKGFAVSSPYWSENPLIMEPGETKIVTLTLQNMVGSEDLIAHAQLLGGKEIARIIDSSLDYDIPFGKDDVKVNVEVSIPKNVPLESHYVIDINFGTESKTKAEGVKLNVGVRKLIDVYVREVPKITQQATKEAQTTGKKGNNLIWAFLLAIIVLVAIIFLLKKRKVDAR